MEFGQHHNSTNLQPCKRANRTIFPNMECRVGSHNLLLQWKWRTIWSYHGHKILEITVVYSREFLNFLNQTSKLAGKNYLLKLRYFFIQQLRKFSLKHNLELDETPVFKQIKCCFRNTTSVSNTYSYKTELLWNVYLFQEKLYETNLSKIANLGETICWGPWMAASSQYSLMWRSKVRNMFTIFNDNHFQKGEKLLLIIVLNFDVLIIISFATYKLTYNYNFGHMYSIL